MGMERLSDQARNLLLEVARMSYGSREGSAGGRGHIGLLQTDDGKTRIIKFDTHGGKSLEGKTSSDNLRHALMEIANAAGLRQDVLAEIRQKLGLHSDGKQVLDRNLLDRTVSAKVAELIGGRRIWGETGYDKATYQSGKETSFGTVSRAEEDSGNVRTVASVKKGVNGSEVAGRVQSIINIGVNTLPFDLRDPVRNLANRVFRDGLRNAGEKSFSENELEAAALKCLFRIVMVKGNATADDLLTTAFKKYLQGRTEKSGLLGGDWMKSLEKDAAALTWSADHGAQYAAGHEDRDADTLLEETLKRALEEDVNRGGGGGKPVMCAFHVGGMEANLPNVGASMAAALRGVFGVKDNTPGVALKELNMFAAFAREHQNSGDFYMKFAADGKTLVSAGSRNILRGSGSKAENNDVRQRLMECVSDFYDGKIPQSVKDVMTGFDGKGHPLSAKRVGLIKAAIDADRLQTAFPGKISFHTLAGCGLTLEDVNESLDELAARCHLSDDEKRIVGKTTLAYLASQAEETSADFRLPDVATLKRQIAEGTCNGTRLALQHIRKVPANGIGALAGDVMEDMVYDAVGLMNEDDVEAVAYFAGKFRRIGRDEPGWGNYTGASTFLLKDLAEHKDELLAFRRQHGKMTLADLWRLRLGTAMPGNRTRFYQQDQFVKKHVLRWMDEFEARHPGLKAACGIGENASAQDKIDLFLASKLGVMLRIVSEFGISLEKSCLLSLGKNAGEIEISPKSMIYDAGSEVFRTQAREKSYLIGTTAGDLSRYTDEGGSFDVKGIPNQADVHIVIRKQKDETKEHAEQNANVLFDAFARMLGYGPDNPVPENNVPNQLKTLMLVCGQAGNTVMSLVGLVAVSGDHYPTQKTFTLLENGQVRFTVAATVGDRHVSMTYDIAQDGTSTCCGMKTQDASMQQGVPL